MNRRIVIEDESAFRAAVRRAQQDNLLQYAGLTRESAFASLESNLEQIRNDTRKAEGVKAIVMGALSKADELGEGAELRRKLETARNLPTLRMREQAAMQICLPYIFSFS